MDSALALCPVILAGGEGNRLWPLSRRHYPKQLIRLFGRYSLLQETLMRCNDISVDVRVSAPLIVCNEAHRFIVAEQAAEISIPVQPLMLEPVGRNTAPALTVAALAQLDREEDPLLLMLPADHVVGNSSDFHQALKTGIQLAMDKFIVSFGIEPTQAATGYGYIKRSRKLQTTGTVSAFQVADFIEKPEPDVAEGYLRSRKYLWNSGILMMQASVWLAAIRKLQPEIYQACVKAHETGKKDDDFFRLAEQPFMDCPSNSVDYAVMEKLSDTDIKAAIIPLDIGWSDIGSWSGVWESGTKDENNNVIIGDVIFKDTTNSLIHSGKRLVGALGCDNLIIIETADAVMVLNKDKTQDMRQFVAELNAGKREELDQHLSVQRPWGRYEIIDANPGYQVKRLTVLPGRRISLQLHHKRSEHWVVTKGKATITKGDEVFDLEVNESTYIPLGVKHRLENRTDTTLVLIEVQVGEYLSEDDIVRYEDDFKR